jgi:hypothetical protein
MVVRQNPTKAATHKIGDYGLVSKFLGYRAREDHTTLPLGTMISPSKNVVMETSGRIAHVRGYALDGSASTVIDSGILSNVDFINFKGDVRNMRCGFLTSAANDGKLQYRYITGTSTINWVNLKTGLTNVRLSFTPDYWDNTLYVKNLLWVDGSNNIFKWNGAVTTFASATVNTVTKQGTGTWASEGFSATGSIVIGGVTATYSGGSATTTLTGVSVDFSATSVDAIVHQDVVTVALSAMTAPPTITNFSTFAPTVIGLGKGNQVYLGSSSNNTVCISKVNDYTNYTFTTTGAGRIAGEGWTQVLQSPPVKFIAQETNANSTTTTTSDVFCSYGTNSWGVFTLTVQITADSTGVQKASEKIEFIILKTAALQGAKSERLAGKMKNNIVFVGNDNVANFFGQMSYQFVPAMVDFSYPIIDDMNSYDFTDGSVFYYKNYVYVTIPRSGIIRIYNMTDQTNQYSSYVRDFEDVTKQPWFWEAPVTYPISGFYVTPDKGLCGHSFTTSESYQLFTGGSFNGQDIDVNATFSYDDKGDRTQSKGSNEIWIEGYIKQNTTLSAEIIGDLDAFETSQTVTVDGSDNTIVAYGSGAHSLGTTSLGSAPIGGAETSSSILPAWFHTAKTYVQVPFYLESVSFSTKGVDLDWKLVCFGTNAGMTAEGNNAITD